VRVGLALLLLVAVAQTAMLPGHFLSRRDAFRMHLPLRQFVAEEYGAGRIPTWNPFDGVGSSVEGSALAMPFHPAQVLLAVMSPESALLWQTLLCVMLAGLGAGLLARRLGAHEPAAWLAAAAYGGSGYVLSITDNFSYLHGAMVVPWALWAADRLANAPTSRNALLLGLVLALGIHGGDVQGALLSAIAASLWALTSAPRRAVLSSLIIAGVFTLIWSAPLVPAIIVTARESSRGSGLAIDEVLLWSLHPLRLAELMFGPLLSPEVQSAAAELVVPALGGHTGALWVRSELIGVPVVVLALAGVATRGARRAATLVVVGIVLALGRWLGIYALLARFVPGWSSFRYPEKLMPFALVGLALLAARGLTSATPRRVLGAALAVLALIIPWTLLDPSWVERSFGFTAPLAETVVDALRARASLALLLAAALAVTAWRWPQRLAPVALTALLLQVSWNASGMIQTATGELLQAPPMLEPVRAAIGTTERIQAWPEGYAFSGPRLGAEEATTIGDIAALTPDHSMRFGVGNIGSYLPGYFRSLEETCGIRPVCTSACARRLGAGVCIDSPSREAKLISRGAEVLHRTGRPALLLFRDPEARMWASFPGARPMTATNWREAFASDERAAFIEGLSTTFAAAPGAVTSASRPRPDEMVADVRLDAPNVLVMTEQCSTGWSVEVDGVAAPMLRADGALCAVEVREGAHHVEWRYRVPGWPWAWVVFFLGTAVALVLARRRDMGAA